MTCARGRARRRSAGRSRGWSPTGWCGCDGACRRPRGRRRQRPRRAAGLSCDARRGQTPRRGRLRVGLVRLRERHRPGGRRRGRVLRPRLRHGPRGQAGGQRRRGAAQPPAPRRQLRRDGPPERVDAGRHRPRERPRPRAPARPQRLPRADAAPAGGAGAVRASGAHSQHPEPAPPLLDVPHAAGRGRSSGSRRSSSRSRSPSTSS